LKSGCVFSSIRSSAAQCIRPQSRIPSPGRLGEAERLTKRTEVVAMKADPEDPFRSGWQLVRGKVLARRGELQEGERFVREGVRLLEPTQYLWDRGCSLLDLAEVLRLAGRPDDEAAAFGSAIELFDRKGDVVSARRGRDALDGLHR
jgi:hypothetical protein